MERGEDEADPGPDVLMAGLRVFPLMVLMTTNSLFTSVLLGGLLGGWIFLVLSFNFGFNYTRVKYLTIKAEKQKNKGGSHDQTRSENVEKFEQDVTELTTIKESNTSHQTNDEASGQETTSNLAERSKEGNNVKNMEEGFQEREALIPRQEFGITKKRDEKATKESSGTKDTKKGFFPLKSALTALWLPSVVGDNKCMFMASVKITLLSKILGLTVAITLALFGHQQSVNPHAFLLWCEKRSDWTEESVGNLTLCSFWGDTDFTSCFDSNGTRVEQKLRVCGTDAEENILRLCLLAAVILSNCLAFAAALWLNKIKNYVELFKATKTLLWFIPTNPVVHRNALISVVKSSTVKDLLTLTEMMEVQDIKTVINRPIRTGDTALHEAAKINSRTKAALLIHGGANINQQNGDGNTPLHAACQNNAPSVAALLLSKGAKVQANNNGETPFFSLVSSNDEPAIKSFEEELKTMIGDISDFIGAKNNSGESPFKHACNKSDWRSALHLKPGALTGDSNAAIEEILTKEALGIQHIVECSAIVPLLQTWSTSINEEAKEEAENKIEAFFSGEIKMIFVPGMEEEKKEWNKCHPMKSKFSHMVPL